MHEVPEFDPARGELVIGTTDPSLYRVIPILNRDKPSYEHTARRLITAATRLNEFTAEAVRRLPPARPVRVRYTLENGSRSPNTEIDWAGTTFPVEIAPELSPLASEVVHHLRTALEYLVFNMVWADTGKRPADWVTAPCYRTEASWTAKLKNKPLSQLSTDNRSAIAAVQPFTGTKWLAELTALSNPDKHHSPIYVVPGIQWVMPQEMVLDAWHEVDATPRFMVQVNDDQLDFIETTQQIMRGIINLANPLLVGDGMNPITMS